MGSRTEKATGVLRRGETARTPGRQYADTLRPWLLSGALLALAATGWTLALGQPRVVTPTHPSWVVLGAAMAVANLMSTDIRIRQHSVSLTTSGAMLLIAVTYLSPGFALVALLTTMTVFLGVKRQTPVRGVFNTANVICGGAAAFWVFRAVIGTSSPVSLRGWTAIAGGCLAFDLVTVSSIVAVVALSGGRLQRSQVTGALLAMGLAAPTNVVLGVLAVCVVWVSPWALGLVILVTEGGFVLLRAQHRLRERYENVNLLYTFSHSLAGLTEAGEVLGAVLEAAEGMLSCSQVELVISRPESVLRSSRHPTGALVHVETELDAVEERVADTLEPLLLPRGTKDPALAEALARRGWRDAVIAPVTGPSGFEGLLIVGDRLGETSTFSPADRRLLETLAAHSSVALRGSELLDRLRQEVAARSHEALHDALTGLGNRTHFSHRLEAALETRGDGLVGVIMVDLNNFKEINDTLGHHAGDAVLQEAAGRLVDGLRPSDSVSRIGGDEFAVVVAGMTSLDDVIATARRIIEVIAEPILGEGVPITLQASLGVAIAPNDGLDPAGLLRKADVAMYAAKANHNGVELYDQATDPNTTRHLRLAADLQQAISDGTLQLWYQPKARAETGTIVGVEALCRWSHPIYGSIPPDEFIPLAEQSGIIASLTSWVLDQALSQLSEWTRQLCDPLHMAVNVSARNLMDTDLVAHLERLIAKTGVDPEQLMVELTESSIMVNPERAELVLADIAALGVRISIDDFGTGYSSLSRLNRLPVSEIKVDKSFVTDMLSSNTEPIVAATIELAARLGQQVTAEGVEDRATWDRLCEMGCDHIQGYYVARPMPAAMCTDWLRRKQPPRIGLARTA